MCADAFEDYPCLSMNASNLKNPEQYDEFVLALQKILIRFAIKMDSCLVAEEDGHIVAAAIYSIRRYLCLTIFKMGPIKLFRFISIIRLFKYFNFVEESERNLEDSVEYDWYLMMLSVTPDYQR
ncbi:MAG: GNAT family acetyltransferase [Streptococcus thermophilus]|nr:GNAT family acetyltransferase [Streptococcus thermophilus]